MPSPRSSAHLLQHRYRCARATRFHGHAVERAGHRRDCARLVVFPQPLGDDDRRRGRGGLDRPEPRWARGHPLHQRIRFVRAARPSAQRRIAVVDLQSGQRGVDTGVRPDARAAPSSDVVGDVVGRFPCRPRDRRRPPGRGARCQASMRNQCAANHRLLSWRRARQARRRYGSRPAPIREITIVIVSDDFDLTARCRFRARETSMRTTMTRDQPVFLRSPARRLPAAVRARGDARSGVHASARTHPTAYRRNAAARGPSRRSRPTRPSASGCST